MEKVSINIKRCKDCEHWKEEDFDYWKGYCEYKNMMTERLDACVDMTELKDWYFTLYPDGLSREMIYGLE